MSTIVQVANFVTPTSGGIRTVMGHLAAGYAAAGHHVAQLVPGPEDGVQRTDWGRRVTLRAPLVRGTGYRVIPDLGRALRALASLDPDRVECHDRTTLRGVGRWASRQGVPAALVSHERLDRWLRQWLSPRLPLERVAARLNADLVEGFEAVVTATDWAAAEFRAVGRDPVVVPLGVDLATFRPRDVPAPRRETTRLVLASRLSREKRPDLAVGALAELVRRGHDVELVVAGDGPTRAALAVAARGLPVRFLGHVPSRAHLAELLASADVVLAPGPVETFGLAALEALACGTPVVVSVHSALPEVVGEAGRAAASSPWVIATAVEELLDVPVEIRRSSARRRAQRFPWSATVSGLLAVHDVGRPARTALAG